MSADQVIESFSDGLGVELATMAIFMIFYDAIWYFSLLFGSMIIQWYIHLCLLSQLDDPKMKVSQVFVNFDCDSILKYYSQIDAIDIRYSNVLDILLRWEMMLNATWFWLDEMCLEILKSLDLDANIMWNFIKNLLS